MTKKSLVNKNIVTMIEEAFYILRHLPIEHYYSYFLGTMPFLLGLFYFWNDMSKNAFAQEYCVIASFVLAVLFIWMKSWQSVFSMKLYEFISRKKNSPLTLQSVLRLIFLQTVFQASSVIILPMAMLITIPYAWVYAVYQLVLIQDYSTDIRLKKIIKQNFQTAKHYTFVNHMVILIFFIFGLFVFFNIGIVLYGLPFMTKTLFGVDSVFTMGGFNILNTTFIFSVFCLTHLCMDPLIKTVYALQKFYYQSRTTGDDLMADLNTIKALSKKTSVCCLLACSLLGLGFLQPAPALASNKAAMVPQDLQTEMGSLKKSINADMLDKSIQDVMKDRKYTWRMPRQKQETDPNKDHGFFYNCIRWIGSQISGLSEIIGSWFQALYDWLARLFPKPSGTMKLPEPKSLISPPTLLGAMGIFICILLWFFIRYSRKNSLETESSTEDSVEMIPDLSDEHILADRLPSDKWMDLSKELLEKGDLRLAVRALYLGTLSYLSEKKYIIIARYKSNREYQLELERRAHTQKELIKDFYFTVRTIDRIWYGMYEIDKPFFNQFAAIQKRIMTLAQ